MSPLTEAGLPASGVWRVAKGPDPFAAPAPLSMHELNDPRAGNRFDSPLGAYRVLYLSSQLEGCFGETLSRFRPDPRLVELVRGEWGELNFMPPGEVPADWRHRRLAVRAELSGGPVTFLDAEAADTRETLARELAPVMAALGFRDLDVAAMRGPDRRLTRWVSQWAWEQTAEDGGARYAGVRYLSRLDSGWECWAVFVERAPLVELQRVPITRTMPELESVARLYGLHVF